MRSVRVYSALRSARWKAVRRLADIEGEIHAILVTYPELAAGASHRPVWPASRRCQSASPARSSIRTRLLH